MWCIRMIYKWNVYDVFKIHWIDNTLEMDILNGHPKWARDGHKGKNIYGLGSNVIKKIALKEIDRKWSMFGWYVSSNNWNIRITHHFWRRGNTFSFMSSTWFSYGILWTKSNTTLVLVSFEGAKALQCTKYTEYAKYYFRYFIYSTPFRKIAH